MGCSHLRLMRNDLEGQEQLALLRVVLIVVDLALQVARGVLRLVRALKNRYKEKPSR